ncbi:MAG: hypothetical protein ACOCV1_00810 [Bacillota bacterium]
MSKSYKKNFLVVKDKNNKFFKKEANKKVRKTNIYLKGCDYKKLYCSWSICDYNSYLSLDDYVETIQKAYRKKNKRSYRYYKRIFGSECPTREDIINYLRRK